MTNTKSTKRALVSSIISLVLCFAMLLGTTYAWFTDSVASANNIITSGNLDVELYHSNSYISDEKVGGLTDLFTVEEGKTFLWEPGAVVWENFKVANEGTLALKYQLMLNFTNATETASGKTLADVLKVAVVAGGFNGTREDAKTLAYNYSLSTFALEGMLTAGAAPDVYGIVIYWQPSNIDNDYNVKGGLSINLGVNLFATQATAEEDSFGSDYDVGTTLPTLSGSANGIAAVKNDGSASLEMNDAPSTTTEKTVIDAPGGAFNPTDKVEMNIGTANSLFNVTAEGGVVAALEINMKVNGAATSGDLTQGVYTVTTYISKGLTDVEVVYTGTDGKAQPTFVSYNAVTGELVFTTSHFSPYAVFGAALAYDKEADTAIATLEKVIEATKEENNTVVIPEANQEAINEEIAKLPADDQEVVIAATYAAKIGDTSYFTLADAFKAAKDGDSIVLLNNVAVDADTTINVANKIVLDLNGKTIAGISDKTGANKSVIVVGKNGDLVVKNGTVTMEHVGANMGWNNSTNALEAVSGGALTIENVVVKNLGGSDMAYAVNIGNNGGATFKSVASVIESVNYNAFRIFNNADGAINVDFTNGTVLTGSGSPFFVHFWSEADLGAKQEARQAYLTVNFNDTKVSRYSGSVSLLRYGFTDALYFTSTAHDTVAAGNAKAMAWAINNNKNVILASNITLNETVTIAKGKNVTLDLNGYTITGTDNTTASFGLFTNNGTFTVKDSVGTGKITLVATENRGWSAFSSVVSNQPGGKFTLESGTLQHLGGTDMAYGIDNLTNGKNTYAETVINGGYVVSTYRAVRMFLNGVEAQNILTVNGGTIKGANKSIWMQDPSANANTGTLTVAADAKLIGDVYLFVCAGSTTWPVEVSIADAAIAEGSKVVDGNVPAGKIVVNDNGIWTVKDCAVVTTADELKAAVAEGGTIALGANITITNKLNIVTDTVINGYNYTLTYTGNDDRVIDVASTTTADLTIKNLTIEIDNGYCQRGINYNVTNGNLVLNNVKITGNTKATYAINLPGSSDGVTADIVDCDITGHIALNVWGANSVITVKNSKLSNYDPIEEEDYSTISLNKDNAGTSSEGTILTITGSTIIAKNQDGDTCIAIINMTDASIVLDDSTEIIGDMSKNIAIIRYKDGNGNYYNEFYATFSIQGAVDRASESTNSVIVLSQNITVDTLNVPADVVVDLNGYTLTVGTYTGEGQLNFIG